MPRWSPDGKHLAFDGRVAGHAVLYRIDAAGGPPTPLTNDTTEALAPSWSRDGRWLYFASNREDGWQIWKMPADGGEAVRVTPDGGYLGFESMDGKTLYFSKYATQGLWSVPAEGGPETSILENLGLSDWGNWTVATDGLYYVTRTAQGPALLRFDPVTRETTRLHTWAGSPLSHEPGLSVSPDGQHLFFARADRIESDIVLVEQFR
jgi:Tol biopolymer transport system component